MSKNIYTKKEITWEIINVEARRLWLSDGGTDQTWDALDVYGKLPYRRRAISKPIRRFTAEELLRMREQGESQTDIEKVRGKTEEQLELDIASDPNWNDLPDDWMKQAKAIRAQK